MTNEELKTELGDELTELERLVFTAMGEASMCWEKRAKGVFDSEAAVDVAHRLIKDIRELYHV